MIVAQHARVAHGTMARAGRPPYMACGAVFHADTVDFVHMVWKRNSVEIFFWPVCVDQVRDIQRNMEVPRLNARVNCGCFYEKGKRKKPKVGKYKRHSRADMMPRPRGLENEE